MKKNKGFTIVELIVTFSVTMVIVVFLFQIILLLKEIYSNNSVKTTLVTKQSIMNQKIYDDFTKKEIVTIKKCGEECITFTFNDSTTSELNIDRINNLFRYGNYTTKIPKGSSFGTFAITTETIPGIPNHKLDSMLIIKIPIINKLLKDNYGINVVYQYNSRLSPISNIN